MLELNDIINDIAKTLKEIDRTEPKESDKSYRPGIGPLRENTLLKMCFEKIKTLRPVYSNIGTKSYPEDEKKKCDLVIDNHWAIEVKLVRPFGDNGKEAENWSVNLLHPYLGNTSAIGDVIKLKTSKFPFKKSVVIVGYEHKDPKIPLEPAVASFEKIVKEVINIDLSERVSKKITDLIHPVHQTALIVGWEII